MRATKQLIVLLITSFLFACSSFELRDANNQLTNLYSATKSANAIEKLNAITGLKTLSDDAANQAEKNITIENQISFYRIATTAAWQSKNYLTAGEHGKKGRSLCVSNNLENRDCGMLLTFPSFAAVDELSIQLMATDKTDLTSFMEIFQLYKGLVIRLSKNWSTIKSGDAGPLLAPETAKRIGEIICEKMSIPLRGNIANLNTSKGTKAFNEIKSLFDDSNVKMIINDPSSNLKSVQDKFICKSDYFENA